MMLSIKEQERIKCQFAAFCKVVLRNAVCSYLRDLGRKRKRETSLDYIIEQKYCERIAQTNTLLSTTYLPTLSCKGRL